MTRVFVFTNHKGGVGKSTSATNIAFGIVQLLLRKRCSTASCRVSGMLTSTFFPRLTCSKARSAN